MVESLKDTVGRLGRVVIGLSIGGRDARRSVDLSARLLDSVNKLRKELEGAKYSKE